MVHVSMTTPIMDFKELDPSWLFFLEPIDLFMVIHTPTPQEQNMKSTLLPTDLSWEVG
jgi:hypothetical protein